MKLKPNYRHCLKPKWLPYQVTGNRGDTEAGGWDNDSHPHTHVLSLMNVLSVTYVTLRHRRVFLGSFNENCGINGQHGLLIKGWVRLLKIHIFT